MITAPATRIILAFLAAVLLVEATGASYGVVLGGYLIGAIHMHAAYMAERGAGMTRRRIGTGD